MNLYQSRVASLALIALVAAVVSRQSNADEPPPQQSLLQDTPDTGTRIRREEVKSAVVPLNRTYQQLTPEQRAHVNKWYESIAPGDEPPFPLEGMRAILDAVRQGQQKLMVIGEVFVVATVEQDGKVSTIKAYSSPSPEMAKFVGSVLLLTKFKPAVCGGQPCRMEFPFHYRFAVR
jgi:hypothetical protein